MNGGNSQRLLSPSNTPPGHGQTLVRREILNGQPSYVRAQMERLRRLARRPTTSISPLERREIPDSMSTNRNQSLAGDAAMTEKRDYEKIVRKILEIPDEFLEDHQETISTRLRAAYDQMTKQTPPN